MMQVGAEVLRDPWAWDHLDDDHRSDLLGYYIATRIPAEALDLPPAVAESPPTKRPTPVTVHGGPDTPAIRQMAETWAEQHRPEHWATTTGSSRASIDYWLDPEV